MFRLSIEIDGRAMFVEMEADGLEKIRRRIDETESHIPWAIGYCAHELGERLGKWLLEDDGVVWENGWLAGLAKTGECHVG